MMQPKELEAELRNKLSMPLVVLDMVRDGEGVSKENVELAISNLKAAIQLLEAERH